MSNEKVILNVIHLLVTVVLFYVSFWMGTVSLLTYAFKGNK